MTPGLIERLEAGPVHLTHTEAYDLAIDLGSDVALGLSQTIRKAFAGKSLDAALALAERVLPGWLWQVTTITTAIGGIRKPFAVVMNPDDDNDDIRTFGEATTPALALCIAILKARATQEQTHG